MKNLLISKGYDDDKPFDHKIYKDNGGLLPIYTTQKKDGVAPPLLPIGINGDIDITKYCPSYIEESFEDYDVKYSHLNTKPVQKRQVKEPTMVANLIKNIPISKEQNDLVLGLVKCLKKDRADNYDDWIKLGWCLYNINTGLVNVWDEFSQHGSSYKPGECETLWLKMKKQDLGLPTLKYWAKHDNPTEYTKVIDSSITSLIDIALRGDGTHYDVAKVIAHYKRDEIVYDKKTYFVVDERNIWKQKDDKFITNLCGSEICRLFVERALYFLRMSTEASDEQKPMYDEKYKVCLKIGQQLKTTSYVKNIKEQLPALFQVDDFLETKLDCNINLFAFNNCVYDIEQDTIRNIEPTDYISITTGYDYNPQVDENVMDEVRELLGSYFATDEMKAYVLNVLTSLLLGKNVFQEFYIFTGVGCNGKSFLQRFIDIAFGNYSSKVNATTFTKASKGANETSEMHNAKGKRYIYCEEPESDDKLITSRLKEFSGDSILKTRGLYTQPVSFMPQFKIFIACNDIPQFSKADKAIARRSRVINFPFVFKDEPKQANEKKLNKDISFNIDNDIRYRQAFVQILIQNWNNIKHLKTLSAPEDVMQASKEHIDASNPVLNFIEDKYVYGLDQEQHKLKSRDIYNHFKALHPTEKVAENTFASRLDEMGIQKKTDGKTKVSYRLGIRKKTEQELDQE